MSLISTCLNTRTIAILALFCAAGGCEMQMDMNGNAANAPNGNTANDNAPSNVGTTIADQSFRVNLGDVGRIAVRASSGQTTGSASGVFNLGLNGTPTGRPANARINIPSAAVNALNASPTPPDGSARTMLKISDKDDPARCTNGLIVGSFRVVFTASTISIENDELEVPAGALEFLVTGEFGICLEVTSTVDIELVIEEIEIEFGEDPGDGTTDAPDTPDKVDDEKDDTDVDVVIIEPDDDMMDDDMKTPDDEGFVEATIRRRGYERILASENVDSDFGFPIDPDFSVNEFIFDLFNIPFALSGDGQKLWFRLYAPFSIEGKQRVQLWCINTDGSGAQRSELPDDDLTNGLHLVTNEDGSVVYANNTRESLMYRAEPGKPATVAFDYTDMLDFDTNFAVNDAGTSMTIGNLGRFAGDASIYTVDLSTGTGVPVEIISNKALAASGVNPRNMAGGEFDLAGDNGQSIFRPNFSSSMLDPVTQDVVYVQNGGAVTNIIQRPFDDTASNLQISDDGTLVSYCLSAPLGTPNTCVIEDLVNVAALNFGDGRTGVGRVDLADNGTRVYYRTSACCSNGSGILQDVGTEVRRPAGTITFFNTTGYTNAQLSDDGNTLAAVSNDSIYILRDDAFEPGSFPGILAVSYRNNGDCTITVRASTISPGGLFNVRIYPWFDGTGPTESVENQNENPTFGIRGGANLSLVDDTVNVWENTFTFTNNKADCAEEFLTQGFNYRVVVQDEAQTAATFVDFSPLD
jgi:hypothetical protein